MKKIHNMAIPLLVPLMLLTLTSCMTSMHEYDGVTGYEVLSQDAQQARIRYTLTERMYKTALDSQILKACAKVLSTPPNNIRANVLSQDDSTQKATPVYAIPSGAVNEAVLSKPIRTGTVVDYTQQKTVNVKVLIIECQALPAAPQ